MKLDNVSEQAKKAVDEHCSYTTGLHSETKVN